MHRLQGQESCSAGESPVARTLRGYRDAMTARRATAALLGLAALTTAAPATALPRTPLRIASFPLAPDGSFHPGDVLTVQARVRNGGRTTVRNGTLRLYLRRTATTAPAGAADATGRVPAVRGGTLVGATASVTLPATAAGAYRLVACVTTPRHARRCAVVRGSIRVGR